MAQTARRSPCPVSPLSTPLRRKARPKTCSTPCRKVSASRPTCFAFAQSPAALEGLLGLNGAVAHGTLGPKVREQIALAVAENNRCDYCLSAHTFPGKHAGPSDADVARARQGRAAQG